MPVILHIGAHKTGTTLVQKKFDTHRTRLERHGVASPKCDLHGAAQHRLAFALKAKRDPKARDIPSLEAEAARLNAALAAKPPDTTWFVSSEALFDLPRDKIKELRQVFAARDVTILAVLRRPDELMLSLHNQRLKDPRNTFTAPIDDFVANPTRLSRVLAQRACVENWVSVFGRDRVRLRRYEDADPLETVLAALDLPTDFIPVSRRVNASTSAAVGDIMRAAKLAGMSPAKRAALLRVAQRLYGRGPRFEPGTGFRRAILDAMEADMNALFAAFGMENSYTKAAVPDDIPPSTASRTDRLLARLLANL